MTLCLSIGMNDMWAIELVKEMYLVLASILKKLDVPSSDSF